MTDNSLAHLENHLWHNRSSRDIRMIIDCARDRRAFGLMLDCFYSRKTCLFSGPLAPQMELVAPYLVELEYEDHQTRRFLREAWGKNWGVFLKSDVRLERLLRHLRSLLLVRDHTGRRLMFRYYDPRILRAYLPTCTVEELREFFGPVQNYWIEDESSGGLLEMRFHQAGLIETSLPVQTPATDTRTHTAGG
jgi:hypothetical protein